MDIAVALVQAYLHVNGYFTVSEYPVLDTHGRDGVRTLTDMDLLALRFPGAGRERRHGVAGTVAYEPDPALRCPASEADMLVVEVKEGRAEFNAAGLDPVVLGAALRRFGCCHGHDAHEVVRALLARGSARTACGHRVRMIAFGASAGRAGPWQTIDLEHVIGFLRDYLNENWDSLRHASFKDPALGLLAVLQKTESPRLAGPPAPASRMVATGDVPLPGSGTERSARS